MKIRLTVTHNGSKIKEMDLDPSHKYIMGRSKTADIFLDSSEVSRNHGSIYFEDGQWKCESISKYGKLELNGTHIKSESLTLPCTLVAPPFELRLQALEKTDPQALKPFDPTEVVAATSMSEPHIEDHTVIAQIEMKPVLMRVNAKGEQLEEIELGDEVIEFGRENTCQIKMKDTFVEGRQFKLVFDGENFVLHHTAGSRPTLVNGTPVKTHKLSSGDEIQAGNTKYRFQLVNADFMNLPAVQQREPDRFNEVSPTRVVRVEPGRGGLEKFKKMPPQTKQKAIRLAIVAALGIFGFMLLQPDTKSRSKRDPAGAHRQVTGLETLSPEQQKYVRDTYNLAESLYKQGHYDSALNEAKKVLDMAPEFGDVRTLVMSAQKAVEDEQRIENQKRQMERQKEIQLEVETTLAECEGLLQARKYEKVSPCVDKISGLDPENVKGQNLIIEAESAMDQIRQDQENRAQNDRNKAQAWSLIKQGNNLLTEGKYDRAIASFERAKSVGFSGSSQLRAEAQKGIQSAQSKITASTQSLVEQGKRELDLKNYRSGILKLREALRIKANNGDALIMMEKAEQTLYNDMKNLYQESVIEEDVGKIDDAKKKWNLIIEQDIPTGEYYKKAKGKMRKYEK